MARTNNNRNRPTRFPIELICGSTPKAIAAVHALLTAKPHLAARRFNDGAATERSKEHEQTKQ